MMVLFDRLIYIEYNMLNRTADTIDEAYPFPAKIRVKIAPYFVRAGALFFMYFYG